MSRDQKKSRSRGLLLASVTLSAVTAFAIPAFHQGMVMADTAAPQSTQSATGSSLLGPDGSWAPLVKQDRPAIVTITTKMEMPAQQQMGPGGNSPYDQFFRQFFGQNGVPGMPGPRQPDGVVPEARALGSGFIIRADGMIVTNNHVVDGASAIEVSLDDGRKFPAKVVGVDARTDLAVLKIDAKDLPTLKWGDSNNAQVGDKVIAIGNPFGVGTTVTAGIISARGRDLHNGPYDDFLQVDAAINHGNSGGALISTDGNVVGITSAIYSPNNGSVGVGFAIPSSLAQNIVAQLEQGGSIERGYLGVQIQSVTSDMAAALNLPKEEGALVASVSPDTPAAKAGLQVGDVVLAVDGKDMKDARVLTKTIADIKPGTQTDLTVWRDGKKVDAKVTLATLPGQDQMASNGQQQPNGSTTGPEVPQLGLSLSVLSPADRAQLGLDQGTEGVLIQGVNPSSAAADQGITAGDVILSANNEKVKSPDDVTAAVKSAEKDGRKALMLLVESQGQQRFVALPIAAG